MSTVKTIATVALVLAVAGGVFLAGVKLLAAIAEGCEDDPDAE